MRALFRTVLALFARSADATQAPESPTEASGGAWSEVTFRVPGMT